MPTSYTAAQRTAITSVASVTQIDKNAAVRVSGYGPPAVPILAHASSVANLLLQILKHYNWNVDAAIDG